MKYFLDYATCPHCGRSTPIRPSMPEIEGVNQISTEMDNELPFLACGQCKCVFEIDSQKLKTGPSIDGLSPFHEGAPLHVFSVPIECDVLSCEALVPIIAVRESRMTDEALKKEKSKWKFVNVKCPLGHILPPFLGLQ